MSAMSRMPRTFHYNAVDRLHICRFVSVSISVGSLTRIRCTSLSMYSLTQSGNYRIALPTTAFARLGMRFFATTHKVGERGVESINKGFSKPFE